MENEAASIVNEPAKKLKLVSQVNLIVANMIGAGVFTTSGFALSDLGSPNRVTLAWLVGGAIAWCGALSYGALLAILAASRHPFELIAALLTFTSGAALYFLLRSRSDSANFDDSK